jgi:hypothetical protein
MLPQRRPTTHLPGLSLLFILAQRSRRRGAASRGGARVVGESELRRAGSIGSAPQVYVEPI